MYNNSFLLVLSVDIDNTDINYLINYESETAIRLEERNGSRSFRWLCLDEVADWWRTDLLDDFVPNRNFVRIADDIVFEDLTDNYGDLTECATQIEALKQSLEESF